MTQMSEMLSMIEGDGLVVLSASDHINQLEVASGILGNALHYSQPIEARVPLSAAYVRQLLPNMDTQLDAFLGIWQWQEEGHANSQADLLMAFGIEAAPIAMETSALAKLASRLALVSPGFHDAMEVGVFTYMAMGELETKFLYRGLAKALAQVHEVGLSRIMGHTARQEGMHLDFQSAVVQAKYGGLQGWQRRLVRLFIENAYEPVGVQRNNIERAAEFGGVAQDVTNDGGLGIAMSVESLAEQLVEIVPSSAFVRRRYKECVDSFLESTVGK